VAGNRAEVWTELNLDFIPPVIDIALTVPALLTDADRLCFELAVSDALSGVQDVKIRVDGQGIASGPVDLWPLPLGEHVLSVVAVDKAGNEATRSILFRTEATLGSLITIKHVLADVGWLGQLPGIERSLDAKLEAAQRAVEELQMKEFRNMMRAFVQQVDALSGKQIDTRAAEVLVRDARYIAEQGK